MAVMHRRAAQGVCVAILRAWLWSPNEEEMEKKVSLKKKKILWGLFWFYVCLPPANFSETPVENVMTDFSVLLP